MLETRRVNPLEEVGQVVQGVTPIDCRSADRESAYAFILDTLVRFRYRNCSRPDKGLLRRYMALLTGFFRARLARLIAQYLETGRIVDRRQRGPAKPFQGRYTDQDMRLLAEVDGSLGQMSGPATRKVLRRMLQVFGEPAYERLAGISNGHLYALRKSKAYRLRRSVYTATGSRAST